ncbi:luciferase-like monooxygenase [Tamaricihabitans halophyticus]|uniref:Luciferase-like monooxygenase n=1 Tax=Tamaricihabitans halophyticus TaxID=1262583 RepID=A0A4R2RC72_9PSEU|nr:LLM class flavin-dependent oxidoreductase [Tamaricihabitans halophyticus]TCP57025.1 luciferase-like monooxygenase [Tamaricihabitans halophyticus]
MRVGIVILPEHRWWAAEPKWRAAEEYGFDHAWTYDHLGWRSLVDGPWFGAVPTLTAAALVTERIRLGTFVASPNFRHPVPFAKELIALDDFSDGRFVLGVGAGGGGYDADVLGMPRLTPGQRVDRLAEFLDLLDQLLRVSKVSWSGDYYTAHEAWNLPDCVQRPRIPFVVAANGSRSVRLAAHYGAGWVTTGQQSETVEQWWTGVAELSARFDEALDESERQRSTVDRYLSLDASPRYALSSVDAWQEAVGRAEELGFTDVVVHWPRESGPYAGSEQVLERVARDALPGVQGR